MAFETFEDAQERAQKEGEEARQQFEDRVYGVQSELNYQADTAEEQWENVKTILRSTPGGLFGGREDIEDRRPSLDDPAPQMPELEIDLDALDQRDLLETISRAQLATLSTLFDISDSVSKPVQVTVSGMSIVDAPGDATLAVSGTGANAIPTKTVYFRASPSNTENITIGDEGVSPGDGIELTPGESWSIDMDLRRMQLYMVSDEEGQILQSLGVY